MRIFNLIFFVVFILFGALQYNDPDPYIWIPVYGYAASLCWLGYRGRYYPVATLVGLVFYAVFGLYLALRENGMIDWVTKHQAEDIAETMQASKPWIESAREFFGLLIVSVVLLLNYIYARKRRRLSVR